MTKKGMKRPEITHSQAKSKAVPIPEIQEKPISDAYAVIDNDLARDNLENDITAADLQDL